MRTFRDLADQVNRILWEMSHMEHQAILPDNFDQAWNNLELVRNKLNELSKGETNE